MGIFIEKYHELSEDAQTSWGCYQCWGARVKRGEKEIGADRI